MSNNVGSTSASAALDGSDDPWTLAKARFLADLDPSERDIFNNATLENLFYATDNANRDDAEKSRVRALATKLGPLVSAIESYGKALDTFAQIAPLYLSPIWGSIRVLLILGRSYGKFFERVVDALGRIGDVLPRFRDYERIYSREKHQRLTQALSNAYLDIIVLCTQFRKTIREQKTSSFRRLLKPVSLDQQFDEAVERFRQHKKNVSEEARICHMIEAAEKRNEELTLFAAERKRRLLSRLSTVGFEYKHQKLKALRYEGTGTWLLGDKKYEKWKASIQSAILCCHGIPGCGKSVLASSIADSLISSNPTMYYYCDYSDKRTLDPTNLFGTLARQMLEKLECIPEALATAIENAAHDGERLTDSSCALDLLRRGIGLCKHPVFIAIDGMDELTEQSQKVVCNGLRELVQGDLLPTKLFVTGREDLSSLLAVPSTVSFSSISVDPLVITSDIRKFVEASTRRMIVEGTLVLQDPTLEMLVVEKLVTGAQGMFLWVEFQLRDLCEAESDYGIRLVLENLPQSLSETYDRLLRRIEGPERRSMILRMFKWIVCARQPLHVDQIREGIAFTLEDKEWSQDKIPTSLTRLIRACGNLVIVDAGTQIVQLAHYTVQQYFLRDEGGFFHFSLKDANEMAGEFCLAYLSFSCFETQLSRYRSNRNTDLAALQTMASNAAFVAPDNPGRRVIQAWNIMRGPRAAPGDVHFVNLASRSKIKARSVSASSFLGYVVAHWLRHTIDFELSPANGRRDRMFKNLICWKELLFDFRPWASFGEVRHRKTSFIALLGWALMADHRYLLRMACGEMNFFNPTQLVAEAWRHFIRIERSGVVIIRDDAISDSVVDALNCCQKESYPFKSAMESSKWLLSQLMLACQNGHLGVLEAVVSNQMHVGMRLLQFLILQAAEAGQLGIVIYLVTCSPKAGTQEEEIRSIWDSSTPWRGSLERAFTSRHFETALYLSSAGYKINTLCPDIEAYFRLLTSAVTAGDDQAAECLLEPEFTSLFESGLLELADVFVTSIQRGSLAVAARILQTGLDPNTPDGGNQVPVIEAIWSRNQEMVSLLLHHGCSLRATRFGLPLTVAAAMGDLAICKLLIAGGAEVFHRSWKDAHAVSMVALIQFSQRDSAVQRHPNSTLLSKHPPTTAQSPWEYSDVCLSPTPLYIACFHGHGNIVDLLLKCGAAANFPSPTHCFHGTSAGLFASDYLFTDAHSLGTDGKPCQWKGYLHGRRKAPSRWKYPLAIVIEQGHSGVQSLLPTTAYEWPFDSQTSSTSSPEIYFSHEVTIQRTIFYQLARCMAYTDLETSQEDIGNNLPN